MRSDLIDLRLFVHVADSGSITAGAARSFMTLASASERIRAMEAALGVPLLARGRRGVAPTPAGIALLRHARLVLRQIDLMQDDLADFAQGLRAQVRVLCNTSALDEHLPGALAGFLAAHPGVSVDLEERPSREIADAVREGTCDMGLASDAVDLAGLAVHLLADDPLVVVVARGHPLAERRRVALADIVEQDFVGLAASTALHDHVTLHARRLGRRVHDRVRLRSLDAVCRLVGAGVGIAIVPRTVATRCARGAGIRQLRLDEPWAARKLVLCVRDLDALAPAARRLALHLASAARRDDAGAAPR